MGVTKIPGIFDGVRRRFSTLLPVGIAADGAAAAVASQGIRKGDDEVDAEEEALISKVVSVLREQHLRSRWGFLRSLLRGRPAFNPSQLARITLDLRNSPRIALRFSEWAEANALARHDLASRAALAHVVARARLRPAALSAIRAALLQFQRDREEDDGVGGGGGSSSPSTVPLAVFEALVRTYRAYDSAPLVFDLLVVACLRAGRLADGALPITRLLRSRGISPETSTCNQLIRAVSLAEGPDAGYDLYKELFQTPAENRSGRGGIWKASPRIETFNALLMAFYRDGELDKETVSEIRAEMSARGCEPDRFTYSILIAALFEEGKPDEALRLWGEMRSQGIQPDAAVYNSLIEGLCRAGRVAEAEVMFREMVVDSGIEPICATYEHLIAGHCGEGSGAGEAMLVYEDMRRKGFRPEAQTVETLVQELCKEGRAEEGVRVLRREVAGDGAWCLHPSRTCCECLIKCLCEEGRMEVALQLQAEMAGKGYEPRAEVYEAFITGYRKIGDTDMALRLEEEMAQSKD